MVSTHRGHVGLSLVWASHSCMEPSTHDHYLGIEELTLDPDRRSRSIDGPGGDDTVDDRNSRTAGQKHDRNSQVAHPGLYAAIPMTVSFTTLTRYREWGVD